jgi:hypothetical protein
MYSTAASSLVTPAKAGVHASAAQADNHWQGNIST